MSLEACLPSHLRAPATTIAPIAAGLSGAGVYRVDAGGEAYVLKVASADEPLAAWRRKVQIQRHAADAGVAPRIVHVDDARRAVTSELVADRSFGALWADPRTRATALALLGRTLRRVHELPLPPDAAVPEPRALLAEIWAALPAGFAPSFVGDAVRRVLAGEPPASERPPVLSHNDVNPTNLVYDGERLLLVDWNTAGANDPFYDLAAIAVFLRMDDDTCLKLIAAHDDAPVAALPARFVHDRRLVAVSCGTTLLQLARQRGHAGATGETLDSTLALADFYQRLRAGAIAIASADGHWQFGLALVKAGAAL